MEDVHVRHKVGSPEVDPFHHRRVPVTRKMNISAIHWAQVLALPVLHISVRANRTLAHRDDGNKCRGWRAKGVACRT